MAKDIQALMERMRHSVNSSPAPDPVQARGQPRRQARLVRPQRDESAAEPSAPPAEPVGEGMLAERIAAALTDDEGMSGTVLAQRLGADRGVVRRELVELESLGLVYRTGRTKATRWFLA